MLGLVKYGYLFVLLVDGSLNSSKIDLMLLGLNTIETVDGLEVLAEAASTLLYITTPSAPLLLASATASSLTWL